MLMTNNNGFFNDKIISVGDPWLGSADPYLWLMDPGPDPTPDPTFFFSDFKDEKIVFSPIFF